MKTKFESFEKHRFFGDRVQELLGRGIFNADGHEWKMQRKTAANIFSVKNFKDFTGSVFVDELALLEKRLAKAIDNKETVDFHDLFHRFTLDGFGKIGFGIELDCMSKDKVPFALAFDRCQSKIDVRFFNPFWQIEEFFNVWKKMELKKDIKTIREFALGIITSRKAESEEQMNQRSDLLTYFLKLRGENGEQLSDQILTDYVLNFIIAGNHLHRRILNMYSQNRVIQDATQRPRPSPGASMNSP